jgi:hypothetical protein
MNREHVISNELFDEALAEFEQANNWIAYNTKCYHLDNADMWFFRTKDEAIEFADSNWNDEESFAVIHADSIVELLKQLPYGESLQVILSEKDIETMFKRFDWNEAFYDPMHDTIQADTITEKADLLRMESLLEEWEKLYQRDPEAALQLAATYWEGKPMEQYKEDFIKIKIEAMIEKNVDYLKNNIRNHGFGDTLGPELEAQLAKGAAEFTLAYKTEVNKKEMEATLYFKKSDTTDMYFFNKYDTRLKSEKDESLSQTFYINKGWGVTLKEAYNLLNGRAVHKELTSKEDQKYQAWIQLDFSAKDKNGNYERKQYHENYGYDLKETLSFYPIKEMMKDSDAKDLVRSLERGNVQMVTLEAAGKDVRVFIEANPQYKSITVYDNKMKRLDQDHRQELMVKPSMKEGKDKSTEQSQDQNQHSKKSLKKSNDDDLDGPKKKTRKKGMGI